MHSSSTNNHKLYPNLLFINSQTKTLTNTYIKQQHNYNNIKEPKHSNHQKLPSFIKINKNLQNSFPQNFFANSKISKPKDSKKNEIIHRNCFKINSQQQILMPYQYQLKKPLFKKYQSIQIRRSTPQTTPSFFKDLQNHKKSNKFKIRSIKSSRASIQRKNEFAFSFEKQKRNILPQTAETLENSDSQELFNITFGNGFKKLDSIVQSSEQIKKLKTYQKMEQILGNKNKFRAKNAVSLQIKKKDQNNSTEKKINCKIATKKNVYGDKNFFKSERELQYEAVKQKNQFYNDRETQQNPFQKIKIDLDMILKKKGLILPKRNVGMEQISKKQRLSKLNNLGW